MKKFSLVLVMVLLMSLLSACFNPRVTQEDQAIVIVKSGSIQEIKFGGGRHWSLTPNEEGYVIGLGVREATFTTLSSNPDQEGGNAWTRDTQPVSVTMTISYKVIASDENVRFMWGQHKTLLESDTEKYNAVRSRFLAEVKDVTTRYTLLEIVGIPSEEGQEQGNGVSVGRDSFVDDVKEELEPQLAAIGLQLVYINLENIDPIDEEYEDLLNEASTLKAKEKVANDRIAVRNAERKEQDIINQTKVDAANTEAQIREIDAKVWENDRAYQIELTKLMSQALGDGDIIVFVPEGSDLTYILNGATGNIVPVGPGEVQ